MTAKEVAQLLDKIGLIDVIIPFMLVFTITYAVLERTKVLGREEKGRRFNIIVSLVISLFTVLAVNTLGVMDVIIRYFVIVLIIGFLMALVLGMAGARVDNKNKLLMGVLGIVIILALFFGLVESGIVSKAKMEMLLFPLIILTALVATIIVMFAKFKKETPSTTPGRTPSAAPGFSPEKILTKEQLEKPGIHWKSGKD